MVEVTIIIPAYNSMPYLKSTLASVFEQTYQDFEVIVVNDGSSDETEEYISSLTDSRLRLINQANQGVSVARNVGISNAQGRYVAFLDADDLWRQTKLEKQVSYLENSADVGLVYTWTAMADSNCKPTGRLSASNAEGNVWQELLTKTNLLGCGSTPLVRKSCFETVGLFDSELVPAEDWDMWLRIAASYSFGVIKEALVLYRANPNSLSKSYLSMWKSSCRVVEKAFQSAPEDLTGQKNKTYSSLYFYLSWLAIKSGDCEQAANFQKQAITYVPQQRYCWNNFRLTITAKSIQLMGFNNYKKLLNRVYFMRQCF